MNAALTWPPPDYRPQLPEPAENNLLERYYLGTHEPSWLRRPEFTQTRIRGGYTVDGFVGGTEGALFISHARLSRNGRLASPKPYQPALVPWALDSMGFSVLQKHGRWTITPGDYVRAVMRYEDEIGMLEWASPQDWMCERAIREGGTFGGQTFVGTGRTVGEHQELTVQSFLDLTRLYTEMGGDRPVPEAVRQSVCDWYGLSPFMPVIQGDPEVAGSHRRCVELYAEMGVDLTEYPIVGVGSVCRLQDTDEVGRIIAELSEMDLALHGFGVKAEGLIRYGHQLTSGDSMAWSLGARRRRGGALPGCTHNTCANCPRYALAWRDRTVGGFADGLITEWEPTA